jgi:hypothetical protein
MGERAYVVFKDKQNDEISPAIYLHIQGEEVKELLYKTEIQMDGRNDAEYASARFVQVCANQLSKWGQDNLSIGLKSIKEEDLNQFELDNTKWLQHGIFYVELPNWKVKQVK